MKKWFKHHKVVLITFAILSVFLFIITAIQINYIVQPHVLEELNNYIETNEITPPLMKYVVMVVINLITFGIWAILFVFIMWNVFFPTRKSMREAFQVDSLEFLYNMPSNLKKELKRDE